ncbi:hypothetical protein BDL97_01G113800, partial [Sphagnum fallax]
MNRTILDKVINMSLNNNVPSFLWSKVINTTTYVMNISPKLYIKKKLKVFTPKDQINKLENHTRLCMFIGYDTFFLHEENASLIRWANVNWAHDLDNRKSTTWMFFKFGHIPLSWTNKLQPIITLSNTRAQYKCSFR